MFHVKHLPEERGAAPHPAGGGVSRPLPQTPPAPGGFPLDPPCIRHRRRNSPIGSDIRRRLEVVGLIRGEGEEYWIASLCSQ